MSKKNPISRTGLLLFGAAICLLLCRPAYAQSLTEEEKYHWFLSRLAWWPLVGFGLGTLATLFWLRRMKYVPEELSINRKVRRAFLRSLLLGVLISAVLLWADLWALYEFETASLDLVGAFKETLRSWQTLPILTSAALGFYAASLVFTRWPFSGRYALWPWVRR